MLKKLFIIRHGETDFNRLNIVQGSGVDTDLNETGRLQARKFFEAYQSHPFDALYTSALKRSQQSVDEFIQKGLPHTILPELNEISWGDFEGREQSHAQKEIYWDMITRWSNGDVHAKIPNGESPFELAQRQQRAIHHIFGQPNEKEVLICMHGRAMKSFLCLLLNEPLSKMEQFQHTNLCLYTLGHNGNSNILLTANDISHLK
jgi:probable phosphoglycerate mutase